jgi:O-antigen ligase/polysaccharide polymerase Wzy-like membrane protein
VVPALVCLAVAAAYRPSFLERTSTRPLDLWLFATGGAIAIQLVPLPRGILRVIDPGSLAVSHTLSLVDPGGSLPITIDPAATGRALMLFAATVLLFATARRIFDFGGVRTMTRIIAVTGLLLSAVALAQSATAHGLMYWRWRPPDEGPEPFGPFVNRNHFATWAVLAVPLLAGYFIAHASAHPAPSSSVTWRQRVLSTIDSRSCLLLASITMLVVALAASLSRSGLVGLAAALTCGGLLAVQRLRTGYSRADERRTRRSGAMMALAAVLPLFAVAIFVGPVVLAERFGTSGGAMADRLAIWHDTAGVVRNFWLTGTGAGTYLTSMAIYQRSKPGIIFNQAHNHYLQLGAEGGIIVGLPILLAMASLVRLATGSLRTDRSAMYWVRAGAAAGLVGVAVQSLWETGLTAPANAALAAILVAITIHHRAQVRHSF